MSSLSKLATIAHLFHKVKDQLPFLFLPIFISSCSSDFEQYYQVTKLRLFAVVAEKPMLQPGESTRLEAFAYSPLPQPITYQWSWCPLRTRAKDRYKCPISRDQLVAIIKEKFGSSVPIERVFKSFDLPDGKQTTFTYPGPEQGIRALCQTLLNVATKAKKNFGISLPSFDCEHSFEIDIRLIIRQGNQELTSVKRLALWLGDPYLNENPHINKLQIRPSEGEDISLLIHKGASWIDPNNPRKWHNLSINTSTPIVAQGKFELRSVVDENSIQIWRPPKRAGSDKERPEETEAIKFSWFISQSSRIENKQSLIYRKGKTILDEVSNIDWIPECRKDGNPSTYPECDEITVWSAIRDGRLGADITSTKFTVSGQLPKRSNKEKEGQ